MDRPQRLYHVHRQNREPEPVDDEIEGTEHFTGSPIQDAVIVSRIMPWDSHSGNEATTDTDTNRSHRRDVTHLEQLTRRESLHLSSATRASLYQHDIPCLEELIRQDRHHPSPVTRALVRVAIAELCHQVPYRISTLWYLDRIMWTPRQAHILAQIPVTPLSWPAHTKPIPLKEYFSRFPFEAAIRATDGSYPDYTTLRVRTETDYSDLPVSEDQSQLSSPLQPTLHDAMMTWRLQRRAKAYIEYINNSFKRILGMIDRVEDEIPGWSPHAGTDHGQIKILRVNDRGELTGIDPDHLPLQEVENAMRPMQRQLPAIALDLPGSNIFSSVSDTERPTNGEPVQYSPRYLCRNEKPISDLYLRFEW